jgi:thiamine transport system ATP-binding protein
MFLEWRDVCRSYANERALDGVTLSLGRGEILGVLGPSGSGKSTLLRVTAGIEQPDRGHVLLEGRDLAGVPPHRRGIGLMFQDYALFPHLDVEGNVAFGLRMLGLPRQARRTRVREVLSLVRLAGMEKRRVQELSGGEQQRVALARSLAPAPTVLMLDEPLGALDAALKADLAGELRDILRKAGTTAVYVTHDREEAMRTADRIALLAAGRIIQAGSPAELVLFPARAAAARIMDLGALVPARVVSGRLETPLGAFPVPPGAGKTASPAVLLIRPAALILPPARITGAAGVPIMCRVLSRTERSDGALLQLSLGEAGGFELSVPLGWRRAADGLAPGAVLRAAVDPQETLLLGEEPR